MDVVFPGLIICLIEKHDFTEKASVKVTHLQFRSGFGWQMNLTSASLMDMLYF